MPVRASIAVALALTVLAGSAAALYLLHMRESGDDIKQAPFVYTSAEFDFSELELAPWRQ